MKTPDILYILIEISTSWGTYTNLDIRQLSYETRRVIWD